MGWNDSRIRLLAPGWRHEMEEVPGTTTMEGKPLHLLHVVRGEQRPAKRIDPLAVIRWLENRGFCLREQDAFSACLTWEDVEAFLDFEAGELKQIILTFTLSRDSPSRWKTWRKLVEELCGAWDLSLADTDQGAKMAPAQVLRLLSETIAWREFERNFGWPAVSSLAE